MTINAGFEFARAQIKYEQANSLKAKLEALQEMYSTAPKHKGSENLRAEISRKIAATRHELEKEKEQASKRGGGSGMAVKKEGAGQIVLIGLPNSGKSTILKQLTGVDVEIADYEFTTTTPQFGMVDFFKAKIQLVEIPAIIQGSSEGKASGTQLLSIVRSSDAVVLVLDSDNAKAEFEILLSECKKADIRLNEKPPAIQIRQGAYKGISITGTTFFKISRQQFEDFLKSQGIFNAAVILSEPVTSIQQVADTLDNSLVYKKALVLVNGKGKNVSKPSFDFLSKFGFELFNQPSELDSLKPRLFELLETVLVYTKKPGEDAAQIPLVLHQGQTVGDLAKLVHKDIAANLKAAKLYGPNSRFDGQKVPLEYGLKNFDIIELDT
ncbi:MAG: GTPase [Candidatus Micrarchaeota archaeon]